MADAEDILALPRRDAPTTATAVAAAKTFQSLQQPRKLVARPTEKKPSTQKAVADVSTAAGRQPC